MVVLVNCFEVPAGREEDFFAKWVQVNCYMRGKRGYLSHRLHRSLSPEAPFRFINVAQWRSLEDFNNAHDEGFQALVRDPVLQSFASTQTVCEIFHEGQAESTSAAD